MSPLPGTSPFRLVSFPRVSGDEPLVIDYLNRPGVFSPRERG